MMAASAFETPGRVTEIAIALAKLSQSPEVVVPPLPLFLLLHPFVRKPSNLLLFSCCSKTQQQEWGQAKSSFFCPSPSPPLLSPLLIVIVNQGAREGEEEEKERPDNIKAAAAAATLSFLFFPTQVLPDKRGTVFFFLGWVGLFGAAHRKEGRKERPSPTGWRDRESLLVAKEEELLLFASERSTYYSRSPL